MITPDELKSLLTYNPDTGLFFRKVTRGSQEAGTVAGTPHCKGYVTISINKKNYLAHRLAWLYMTGNYPESEVDHKDRDKSNNRFSNLRSATRSENSQNVYWRVGSTSKYPGVYWKKDRFKWFARIRVEGKRLCLGYFTNEEDAAAAYDEARKGMHTHTPKCSREPGSGTGWKTI